MLEPAPVNLSGVSLPRAEAGMTQALVGILTAMLLGSALVWFRLWLTQIAYDTKVSVRCAVIHLSLRLEMLERPLGLFLHVLLLLLLLLRLFMLAGQESREKPGCLECCFPSKVF
jgi:hypothetical protein